MALTHWSDLYPILGAFCTGANWSQYERYEWHNYDRVTCGECIDKLANL